MAGYEIDEGYWLPRGNVTVPEDLEELLWPWIDEAEMYILGFSKRPTDKPTALEFLKFLKFMQKVFIQDVAAMLCTLERSSSPNGAPRLTHNLFSKFALLASPKFISFKKSMEEELNKAAKIDNEPTTKIINKCLPGINKRFEIIHRDIKRLCVATEETNTTMEDTCISTSENLIQMEDRLNDMAKKRQFALVTALSDFFRRRITQHASDLGTYANRAANNPQPMDSPLPIDPTTDFENSPTAENTPLLTPLLAEPTGNFETPLNNPPNESCPVTQTPHRPPEPTQTTITTPTTGDHESPEPETNKLNAVSNKILSFRFIGNHATLSLEDVYCEFFGLLQWSGQPIDGGFYGLEKSHKSKWRSSYSDSEKNFFSRTQSLVKGICDKVGVPYGTWDDRVQTQCRAWDAILKKKGIAGSLRFLQGNGDIGKKGQRKRS